MENENTPTPPENKAEAPAVLSSPGLSSTKTEADAEPNSEPTMSANQAGLADATEEDSREQPVASRRPEREPEHTGSAQECSEELQMEEPSEMPSEAGPGNQSPLATQEGSMELQAVEEQAQSMELQAVKEQAQSMELQAGEGQAQSMELQAGEGQAQPSGDCVTPEGQPEPAMDQQEDLQSAEAQEIHPSQSCQVIPGDWGAKEPPVPLAEGNTDHGLETACTLDNRSQAQVDEPPSEAGLLQVRLQEPMPVPSSGTHKDSPPEPVSPKPMATAQEKKALPLLQSVPGPRIHKDRSEAVETKATPRPLPFTEVRDLEKKELTQGQKQRHQALAAVGAQGPGNHRRGFMKCLLEVEEQEEATHRRTLKTRTLTARKSSKNLTSVPTSGPTNSSVPSLPLTLNEPSNSAPATMAPWVRTTGPGQAPASGGSPGSVLSLPTQDLSWRWPEMLPQSNERNLNFVKSRQELEEHGLYKLYQSWEERSEEHLTLKQEEAFRSYFDLFNGSGEVDARSLKNVLLLIGLNLTPAQLEEALMSADVNGDGHVDFKDFLAVMTDTKRFLYSVEQNVLMDMSPLNPYTLFFEILSLLVEMLALPEVALEEITNYYQKKLKEGSSKAREMESAISSLRSRKKLSYNPQQADNLEVPERRVLRILSRLKQQNYAANLQSPYAQVPCIPLCPRLDKKTVRRKQGSHNHSMLDHCVPTSLGPEIHGLFFQSGQQASREHSSDSRKWLNSVPARTH